MGKKYSLSSEEIHIIEKIRGENLANSRPRLKPDEVDAIREYRRVRNESDSMGIDYKNVRGGWLKTKEVSLNFVNPDFADGLSDNFVVSAIEKAVSEIKERSYNAPKTNSKKALRGIISDAHVGMNPSGGDALFGFDYNEKIFKQNLDHFFSTLVKEIDYHGAFDTIFIDDLGDGLDGFDGQTTRGGHDLPQNMTNQESWNAYVNGKLESAVNIIELEAAKNYVFRNVVNCNHAGDWGWSANKAIQMVLAKMYPDVTYHLITKPIEHFEYGKHTFILTHGKDKGLMSRNWPLNLNDKVSNLIRQYIDHYEIRSPYVHVDKGDLHRVSYDRDPRFDYRNFMSFAPPSKWVMSNFGISYSGYSIQVISKDSNNIQHTDIFFDLKKI